MVDSSLPTRREFVASASLLAAGATSQVGLAATASQTSSASADSRNAALTRRFTVSTPPSPDWPVLTRYDPTHLTRIAMPIGGIGTGTISLGGRGHLRDWELVNKPAKGYTPIHTHFALFARSKDRTVARALEGPIDLVDYEGSSGSPIRNHGLPRFRECNFAAAYPLGQVLLADADVPVQVRIEAFNPMIPGDADASGIPVAILRFVLINPGDSPVEASICGTIENFIGWDGSSGTVDRNVNRFRESGPLRGLFMRSEGLDPKSHAWGTLALATTADDVTHRSDWAELKWDDALLDFWDDFSADGKLEPRESNRGAPFASLAAALKVPAGGTSAVTFLIGWHFPNRMAWNPPHERVGNFYCTQYSDAWDALARTAPRLAELERTTVEFVRSLVDSDLPPVLKEAALYNTSTLRTQTSFRAEDGRFFGWEGCNDHGGCCHGSCTHVWNYEQATPFLYGSLARSMQEVIFGHATQETGFQSFRVNLPLLRAQESRPAAADGQMGMILRLWRDWRLSGDEAFLKNLWPHARKSLEFAWIPGGWDADRDGVMEGCQHNTMDVEYYGPNPEVGVWYLGALRAAEEMARHLGEDDFAKTCRDLFDRGSRWLDAKLFNGEYYEHQIVAPGNEEKIAEGLRLGVGASDLADPELQLGRGCLTDQLVGQVMAHVCGLGFLLDREHQRTTLRSILKHNWRDGFIDHFNHRRSYALGDDQGLLVATYPRGDRPKQPFPYAFEVWSGLEYTAAAGMLYEGMEAEALKVIAAVRARHDGRRRNPFNEPECGHHYARAMASWACLLAYTGFRYDAVARSLTFRAADRPATWFWSAGSAWGIIRQKPVRDAVDVTLECLEGALRLSSLSLEGRGSAALPKPAVIRPGKPLHVLIR